LASFRHQFEARYLKLNDEARLDSSQPALKKSKAGGPSSLVELEELDDSELEADSGEKIASEVTDDEDGWDAFITDDDDDDDKVSDFEMY